MADDPDIEITISDLRDAGHCAKGMRPWFRQHGLDIEFQAMIKGGSIPASKMLATGDPRALRVVRLKRDELRDG